MTTGTDTALRAAGLKDLQAQYEKLRQNHIDGVGGLAMSVFLREGMCGWIRVWMHHGLDAVIRRTSQKASSKMHINDETGEDMGQLVGLIASITLEKLKGV
jgi:hypothetical protein